MASYKNLAFAALLLVFMPLAAKGDLHPALSPFYERLCEDVECGKGTCRADISYHLNYICECDSGWKRTKDDNNTDDYIKFLPCVIPNCTLDYSCQTAPPPVPEKEIPLNSSYFDPCYWTYCGQGTCNKTSTYKHLCQCNPGYSNLLNKTYFPCYSPCTLGSDCTRLGIKIEDQEGITSGEKASRVIPGKLHLACVYMMAMAIVVWK